MDGIRSIIGEAVRPLRRWTGPEDNAPMQTSDWIGYAAATLTTASFVPQALHTFRTKDVRGISLAMYSAFVVGILLWLVYGLLLGAWPIVIANAVTLTLAAAILAMKLKYR